MTTKKLEQLSRVYYIAMKAIRDGGRGTNRYESVAFKTAIEIQIVQADMPDMPIPIASKAKYRVEQRFTTKGAYVGRTGQRNRRHNKRLNYKW